MLRIVTDSHVPPAVAQLVRRLAPVDIPPLREWHDGKHLYETDPRLLSLAWEEHATILTYDLNSFPYFVKQRLEAGLSHAGVIYVSARFRQNDVGGIARGLVRLWRSEKSGNWTNRIYFLQ